MILNYARCRETLPSNRRKPSSPRNPDEGSMGACVDVMPGIGAKNTFRRSNFAFDRSGNRRQGKSASGEIGVRNRWPVPPLLQHAEILFEDVVLLHDRRRDKILPHFPQPLHYRGSLLSLLFRVQPVSVHAHSHSCRRHSQREGEGAGANSRSESGCRESVARKPRKEPTGSSGTPETTGDVGRQSRVNLRRVES